MRLHYGFLDESGDVVPFTGSDFLVVAVLLTSRPRPIALHVKRAFRSISKRLEISEFKAARVPEVGIERLLIKLAGEDMAIVAVVTDKRGMVKLPDDPEEMFRRAAALVVRHCTARWPRLALIIDKRYTKPAQRQRLDKAIRETVSEQTALQLRVEHIPSYHCKELQAADGVAWAIWQKYEHGDDRFYRIIADKVIMEEVIKAK